RAEHRADPAPRDQRSGLGEHRVVHGPLHHHAHRLSPGHRRSPPHDLRTRAWGRRRICRTRAASDRVARAANRRRGYRRSGMKDPGGWEPSKFVYRHGKLVASRDTNEVAVGSRLMVDRVARCYDTNLREHAKGRLVDLGCGTVPLYRAYADLVTEVTCVDIG